MPAPQTVTLTATSTDTTTFTKVVLADGVEGVSSQSQIPQQALRIEASCVTSTGTATARFILRSSSTVYGWIDVLLTTTSTTAVPKTSAAGSTGGYMMVVTATNDRFLDLTGYDRKAGLEWYVGLSALSDGVSPSINLYLFPTRAI